MKAFARFIVRKNVARIVVLVVLGLSALAAFYANRVIQDDDMLAFLPKKNPEVVGFREVSDRFGSMDVALVGIESDDVFGEDFLDRLTKLTKRLKETEGLDYTLSITNVEDVSVGQGGELIQDPLIKKIPKDGDESAALREHVLSRDHIVGNLVSADGRAVLIYCFATPGAQPRATAQNVRSRVEEFFPKEKKYWGGAPFVSTYIYDVTQSDLKRLAPWACLAIAVMVLLSFKDLLGTGLALLATLLGVVFPLGIMGLVGVHTNIVLGSMPVILFALGSAYGVHILTRFYSHAHTMGREEAVRTALEEVGPSVLGSGITTVFGLLSFVMMDIKPMQTFGIFTALGLTIALVLAVTFVPAVLVISPLKGQVKPSLIWVNELMARLCIWVQRRRLLVGIASLAVTVAAGYYSLRVDSRMDTAAFFDKGSPPADADEFMRKHFGGSQFIQVQVKGDMTDPVVLREVQLLADRIALVDGVSSVQHIGGILAQVNEAANERVRRIPKSVDEVRGAYVAIKGHGDAAIGQLVTENRDYALINVKVVPTRAIEVEVVLKRIEQLTAETFPKQMTIATDSPEAAKHRAELVSAHIAALAAQLGTKVTSPELLRDALATSKPPVNLKAIEASTVTFLQSDTFKKELSTPFPADPPDVLERLAHAVVAIGEPPPVDDEAGHKAWRAKVGPAIAPVLAKEPSDPMVDEASLELERNVPDFWFTQHAKDRAAQVIDAGGLTIPEGSKGARLQTFIGASLLDLETPTVLLPGTSATDNDRGFATMVTGLPVLYRGLSNSVFNNQWNSLWFALLLVIGLKALLFRSLWTGILTSIPTLLTLLVVYGAMGFMGVHLDIGTSMLASLIIGAGDDYAVEFLWSWSAPVKQSLEKAAANAAKDTGAGIWTNAAMVAVGFYVLTLGEARPLQNVGGLTAAAMVAAAIATFVITPLLARRHHYAPIPAPTEHEEGAAESVKNVEAPTSN